MPSRAARGTCDAAALKRRVLFRVSVPHKAQACLASRSQQSTRNSRPVGVCSLRKRRAAQPLQPKGAHAHRARSRAVRSRLRVCRALRLP